jgi:PAS domain S-box-containing protein
MNAYIIIPVIAFFINVVTMSYISALDYRKSVIRAFLLFTGIFTVWIFLGWFFYLPVNDDFKVPLGRFSSVFWAFSGFSFLHFAHTFLERKRGGAYYFFLAASCATALVSTTTGLVISEFRYYPWGWRFTEGPLFNYASLFCVILPVLWSWALFFRVWVRTGESTRRTQLGIMVSGIFFALGTAVVLHYLIPALPGMEKTVRYNSQASCILSFFIFYAIIRYRFLAPGVRDVAAELFATMADGVVILSSEGRVLQMNASAVAILGLDSADPAAVSLPALIENFDLTAIYKAHQTVAGGGDNRRPVLLNQSEIIVRGSPGGRILTISDISDIAKMHAAVEESEARLSMIAANVSDLIWIFDLATYRLSYVSPSVLNMLGWSPEEYLAMSLEQQVRMESLDNALSALNEELAHDAERDPFRNRALDLDMFCVDGTYIETEIKVTLIRSNTGVPTGLLGITRDITQRKRLERELSESLAALRARTNILEKDIMMAQSIQRALLPDGPPSCEGFRIEYKYLPLEAVGGDYFNIIPLEEGGLSVFLGDVSGHGVPAALFLSLLKSESSKLLREYASEPVAYITALNAEMLGNMHSYFITAVYGLFTRNGNSVTGLKLVSAGHPPPILHRQKGDIIEYLDVRGKVLGVHAHPEYLHIDVPLGRGDRVFFYTDGLPEMMNPGGELLGFDRLLDVIRRSRQNDLTVTLDEIMADVNRYRDTSPLTDDTVIIGIEVL